MKEFNGNGKVMFGDVCLSGYPNAPRQGYSPGQGGWPTVRIFNKETGIMGAPYSKVTGDATCTELGPGKPHLQNWIRKYAGDAADASEATAEATEATTAKEEL